MEINIPESIFSCYDPRCKDLTHLSEIDTYMKAVLDDISEAAEETIPKTNIKSKGKNRKDMAGKTTWSRIKLQLSSGFQYG